MQIEERRPNKPNFKLIFILFLAGVLALLVIAWAVVRTGGRDFLPHHAIKSHKDPNSLLQIPAALPQPSASYSLPV